MGGYGSGRWGSHNKKRTVESCHVIEAVRGGKLHFTLPPGRWTTEVKLREGKGTHWLTLRGERSGWTFEEVIELIHWKPRFGGFALWLLCPGCGRRGRKLFAPPHDARFRCRKCWNLTYTSSQEAHHWDRGVAARMMAPFVLGMGTSLQELERVMRAGRKSQFS